MKYVALLRGINVGGRNSLPMKDLIAMFEKAGASDVKNYIQSGNIVFSASASLAKKIGSLIGAAIKKKYGFESPVIIRSATDLSGIVARNPFAKKGDADVWHITFLSSTPSAEQVGALDAKRSPTDSFAVVGSEIFLYCPNGYGNTKLTNAYFDSKLKMVSTVRNWRTLLKLIEMCG
jgi:uncharacterized protein (DUF1697 family)